MKTIGGMPKILTVLVIVSTVTMTSAYITTRNFSIIPTLLLIIAMPLVYYLGLVDGVFMQRQDTLKIIDKTIGEAIKTDTDINSIKLIEECLYVVKKPSFWERGELDILHTYTTEEMTELAKKFRSNN